MPQNTNDGTMALETDLTGIRVILIGRILFFFRLFSASLWIPSSPIYFTSTSLLHWFHLAGLQVLCEWSHILASLLNNAHQGIHFISNSLLWTIFAEVLLNRLLPQSNVVPLKNILLHTYHVKTIMIQEDPLKGADKKRKEKNLEPTLERTSSSKQPRSACVIAVRVDGREIPENIPMYYISMGVQ